MLNVGVNICEMLVWIGMNDIRSGFKLWYCCWYFGKSGFRAFLKMEEHVIVHLSLEAK
jgi:hypothetical protein